MKVLRRVLVVLGIIALSFTVACEEKQDASADEPAEAVEEMAEEAEETADEVGEEIEEAGDEAAAEIKGEDDEPEAPPASQ